MSSTEPYLTPASERYLVDILSYLHQYGESNVTKMKCIVQNGTTLNRTLARFEKMGLMTIRTEVTDRYVLKMIGLTDAGMKLAVKAFGFRKAVMDSSLEQE